MPMMMMVIVDVDDDDDQHDWEHTMCQALSSPSFPLFSHLIFTTALWERDCYYPHCTYE